jgi:hypothetical protein
LLSSSVPTTLQKNQIQTIITSLTTPILTNIETSITTQPTTKDKLETAQTILENSNITPEQKQTAVNTTVQVITTPTTTINEKITKVETIAVLNQTS